MHTGITCRLSFKSNNLVFTSITTYFKEVMASNLDHVIPHVIITVLEHDSVALTARTMARKGLIGEGGKGRGVRMRASREGWDLYRVELMKERVFLGVSCI